MRQSTHRFCLVWGEPDGNGHPYVGILVFDVGGVPFWSCSGTLLSPRIVLTAGHCTYGTSGARIWFENPVTDSFFPFTGGSSIEGIPYTHPRYADYNFPNTSDVGVVVLDEPVRMSTYGVLPSIGFMDQFWPPRGPKQRFTIVGYGLQSVVPVVQGDLERYWGMPMLVELNSANTRGWNIHLTSNPGKPHPGGECYGDSGGPVLDLETPNLVVGVISWGLSPNCVGAGFAYRVDTRWVQRFINQFLR